MKNKKYVPRAAEATMETLREHFKPHLGLSKARLTCFLMLVLAVIGQRTVSLVWSARHPITAAKPESVYRRFQRFFAFCALRPLFGEIHSTAVQVTLRAPTG